MAATVKRRRVDRRSEEYRAWHKRAKIARVGLYPVTHEAVRCEHCRRRTKRECLLMEPAIMSGHRLGDWVCMECHPLAEFELLADKLNALTTPKSKAG